MIEAIWTLEFVEGDKSTGAGVLIFDDGRVYGGDSHFYTIGHYAVNGGRVCIRTTMYPYRNEAPAGSIVRGRNEFDLELAGQVHSMQMVLSGAIVGEPGLPLTAVAKRRHEIPSLLSQGDPGHQR